MANAKLAQKRANRIYGPMWRKVPNTILQRDHGLCQLRLEGCTVIGALSLPAIAVAADGFMRRQRVLGAGAVALLLAGFRAIRLLVHRDKRAADQLGTPGVMLAIRRVPLAEEVPSSLRPDPDFAPEATVGWLLDGVADGRVPDPGAIKNPFTRASTTFRLSFLQSRRPAPQSRCESFTIVSCAR
jgi:hypothetical protein